MTEVKETKESGKIKTPKPAKWIDFRLIIQPNGKWTPQQIYTVTNYKPVICHFKVIKFGRRLTISMEIAKIRALLSIKKDKYTNSE